MFVFITSMTVICLAVIILIKSSEIIRTAAKYSVRIIASLLILLSAVTLIVDLPAYMKGGYEDTGKASVIKLGPVEVFSVEETGHNYWRFEFDGANESNIYTCPNPKNTEIMFRSLNDIKEYTLIFTYLPMSKYITEIKPINQEKVFTHFSHESFDTESKAMCVVLAVVFIWLVVIVIKKFFQKNKNKNMNFG